MNITKEINNLVLYKNGNVDIQILTDGTKIRTYIDEPIIEFPESIDVKITNYCDMNCLYCHEKSTIKGKHADLDTLYNVLEVLPKGVELAIGGGNPISHPDIIPFLTKLKEHGFIANLTINQGHLKPYFELIKYLIVNDLVKGIGISITSNNFKYIKKLSELSSNIVYHIIAGINYPSIIDDLQIIDTNCKVLILGYKKFGFGVDYYSSEVDKCLSIWRKRLHTYLTKCTISFDNLAIEQLNVKQLFTKEDWEQFYMGDDFTYTMYIDAIKQEYAPTSRSDNKYRRSFNEYNSLINYFKNERGRYI